MWSSFWRTIWGFRTSGATGGEIATPQLDALADEGLRFTQFYNTARCWPTRGALMTGYYAQAIHRDALPGLSGGGSGKRQQWAWLLPDFLKTAGYRSYHSGKWHIDGKVLEAGVDRSLNVQNQGNFFTGRGNLIDDVPVKVDEDEKGYYTTTATADHAIDCLQSAEIMVRACNTPYRRHKTWVHEGGISTPLIVHWPAGIKGKGELRHTAAHVIDIAPTVLALAGVEKPKEWVR